MNSLSELAEPSGSGNLIAETPPAAEWHRNSAAWFGLSISHMIPSLAIDKMALSGYVGAGSATARGSDSRQDNPAPDRSRNWQRTIRRQRAEARRAEQMTEPWPAAPGTR